MTRFTFLAGSALVATLALSTGCTKSAAQTPPPGTPEAFLKWSMDKYKAMPAFQADGTLAMTTKDAAAGPTENRRIRYVAPNRFSVVSSMSTGVALTSVSDGQKLVEYSSPGDTQAATYPAPDGIAEVNSMQMRHPMFCGSLLYQFFAGSGNIRQLVDFDKGAIAFGDEMSGDGELARVVKFYGTQNYGHVQALIGETSGRVYRITYDSEPLLKMMKATDSNAVMKRAMREHVAEMKPGPDRDRAEKMLASPEASAAPTELNSTEIYTNIKTDPSIAKAAFDVALPKGMVAVEMPTDRPPVPIGSPAPDIEVTGLTGSKVKLSSMRGHVVLLDFWATWCPPCRKGLPETARLAKVGVASGLQVLAISGEDRSPVADFLKKQPYQLPAYLDSGGAAAHAYGADAIPTTAIIDAGGNLSAYYVGLQDEATLDQAVEKAGARLSG